MASAIYNKHPQKDCIHAISMHPVDGLQRRGAGGPAPFPAGDETTVLRGGGLNAAADLRKILVKRKELAYVAASSMAWPSLWPQSCQQQVADAKESPQRAESPETPGESRS
jgi:hypothetical protein